MMVHQHSTFPDQCLSTIIDADLLSPTTVGGSCAPLLEGKDVSLSLRKMTFGCSHNSNHIINYKRLLRAVVSPDLM